jgi:signal transduction histidine kinase
MTLRRRSIITALILTLPAAALVLLLIEWRRGRDAQLALERVAAMHLTETVRDACQADPQWFLAGPRSGRPPLNARNVPDADVVLPRPDPAPLPIDLYAYDQDLNPMSTAAPALPRDLRNRLRPPSPTRTATARYATPHGTGRLLVQATGWTPGPCAFLMFRMEPAPGRSWQRTAMFLIIAVAVFAVAHLAAWPTIHRLRRVAAQAGSAARDGYRSIAPDAAKDDIGAMTFVYNEAAAEIHRRGAETQDRVEALRRFVRSAELDLAPPLSSLETGVSALVSEPALPPEARRRLRDVLLDLHGAGRRLRNLVAAAELRMTNDPLPREPVDLVQVIEDLVARYRPLARASGVSLDVTMPPSLVAPVHGPMLALAIENVLDNAIRYNREGGTIAVTLEPRAPSGLRLRIVDTGRGVDDTEMKLLTAIRRFRGDESWNRRPGAPGLGLALSREIADRSGLTLELHRPAAGGFEVEIIDAHS